MGKVYVILSGKGGVGKTTSAINLGTTMNAFGKEVIIVDANLTTPNVGLHLGSPIVPTTLNDVLNNKSKPDEAIYEHESGTKILPSSLAIAEMKKINHNRLADVTKRLRKISDYTVIDSSAGLGEEARAAIKSADEVIIITNPEMSAVTDALKAIKLSEQMKKEVLGCVITRHTGSKLDMDLATIRDMLEVPILGIVPEDRAIKESQAMKRPVIHSHPRSKAAKAYHKITRRILGPEYINQQMQLEENAQATEGLFKTFIRKIFG
jgi:septum site-determining protein MinD